MSLWPLCSHDLRDRLIGADWYEDYAAYGLTSRQIEELKAWVLEWSEDRVVNRQVHVVGKA